MDWVINLSSASRLVSGVDPKPPVTNGSYRDSNLCPSAQLVEQVAIPATNRFVELWRTSVRFLTPFHRLLPRILECEQEFLA